MIEIKPRVFIGSSTEGKNIAEAIERELSDICECKIWYNAFEYGNSAYEDLIYQLSLYDYGILVATSDDTIVARGEKKESPRDNVILEFGFFAGRLGRQRAFLFAEYGIKIPSDLGGITQPFFPTTKKSWRNFFKSSARLQKLQKEKVVELCGKIKVHIQKREKMFDFGFLPSTALAYGYYNNFILKAVSNLMDAKKLKLGKTCNYPRQCQRDDSAVKQTDIVDGINFSDLMFTILLPDNLSADMFDKVKAARTKSKWEMIKVDAGGFRPFDFFIEAENSSKGVLQLSDIPLTLNALNEAIKAYIGKSYIGILEEERLLEGREIRVFKKVLDYLISVNPITKGRVRTELIDI
ncbi:MAG: nucleotide-binding protein [Bacteroidia bacterium]|nr:nucleotide-binding protein [Bacteroidota bacterium]MBP6412077.1 nucleotide-binding protein [Bacteroidia bacterium]